MKSMFLFCFVFLCFHMRAQNIPYIKAQVLSVSPDHQKYPDENFSIEIKLTNHTGSIIAMGDSLLLTSLNGLKTDTLESFVVYFNLDQDSSKIIYLNGYFRNGQFEKATNGICMITVGLRDPYSRSYKDTNTYKTYIAQIDFGAQFPRSVSALLKSLEVNYMPQLSQLDFKYYADKTGAVAWSLTDRKGRRISHGFLDVAYGIQSYSLIAQSLTPGRYTLSIGDGTDEIDGTFTVIGR